MDSRAPSIVKSRSKPQNKEFHLPKNFHGHINGATGKPERTKNSMQDTKDYEIHIIAICRVNSRNIRV
jgi:hypothetical protein